MSERRQNAPRVLFDACVLFPPLVRAILIGIADAGLIRPLWSERIFDEWRLAVVRKHGIDAEFEVAASQAVLNATYPDASVPVEAAIEDRILLPDPADAHVLAAAIAGCAHILVTFNLRDFPQRTASEYGIEIAHPDGYLWRLLSDAPVEVGLAVGAAMEASDIPREKYRSFLKRARLSRFGKALEATGQV